ncbi:MULTISPECIES: 23S rRNA (uracil(1939)-C(5))-methyltransferase RlmD [unclassified Romboutsia]|uniref:23S rRNA (uracil(1939)-C(5))-methyltransferase RlmD n=1 Tax=unclassified Romboutsia TaxID=2626894 RepID=UPI00232FCC5A|nr:23S rRNA (uracil(1939)-C(5))-methyltransferase RlmD [Romboutsia sp. 1001216sp1]MDB8805448.1 23S rRNA (uracil(1939)-C(5))-methyltransferase RlmD [Romboutsia sp. 1001216sp1]MDB8807356.1 23S rRNA (uracil(1939)-C(5))-methyltransferase RlmD [Romboutsia sp. 1001216sp1]MDB8811321.1 23S rRNA (uracil(1939)-C(5))-methyltransferase RlmD [Romboutsia sp. 1001216sp1]MDB8817132.1 23S rRNA (uracil(1939)-C(5))-methyltransferase RlmD [Romboutsia sp. 1001216sp1]MDB8819334.1 23S rRNA (uracil(1939)-C(5))-methyl
MKRRDIIEFEIDKMEFGGTSVSLYDGKDIYMKGGITGQKVKAVVQKARSKKAEVKMLELLENSPLETEEPCKHFNQCGGCSILSVPYEKQLQIKERQVMDLFLQQELFGFKFLGIQGSPEQRMYRNKMEYTFGDEVKDGPLSLGLHKKGKHIDIITVDGCYLVDQDFINILKATVDYFNEKQIPYYRTFNHKGYLRNLVVRKGINTKEMMVNIVTSSQLDFDMTEYKNMLLNLGLDAELVSILHTINDGLADAVNCDELRVLYGRDYIQEEILGLKFKISPFSFFQTNTKGAEELYSIAREFVGDHSDKVVFDLYSGTGTIGQVMAGSAKKVYGIEIIEEAVAAANQNAKLNGLTNCEFIAGDVAKTVNKLKEKPDLIIVDPPRPGVHKDAIRDICGFDSKEIIYISCNPKTLVLDLVEFKNYGYEVELVKCMDMFPNTPHVETVVKLKKA